MKRSRATDKPASLPVLVIEDDPVLLEHLCTTLESNGYPVVGQSSETDIVRLLPSSGVAGIVVGTQHLKGLDGTDFSGWLSQHRPDLEKRAIFLASVPFKPKRFLSAVRKTIGQAPATERILVVDDEEPIREIVAFMLGFMGYRCRTVKDPGSVLA